MLKITVPRTELFDDVNNEFIVVKEQTLQLEHSLLSIAKWEMKYKVPFLSKDSDKTLEQIQYYVECMTINKVDNKHVYLCLTNKNYKEIEAYINDPMTATTIKDNPNRPKNREIVTNELIYYWMISLEIPTEFEKWHLNRLLTLIQVCNIKNSPSKRMGAKETAKQNRSLNAARKKRLNTRG